MYMGFKLKVSDDEAKNLMAEQGVSYQPIKATVRDDDMVSALSTDSANWIMDNWFKSYDADIFLSHSHGDEKLAQKVSAKFNEMGLRVFIDSDVWGCSERMLREIDDKHCGLKFREDGKVETYDYNRRNKTTSHVHILLAHALMRMIEQSECFIFLETRNSSFHSTEKNIDTYSPWLFHELSFVNVVKRQELSRKRYTKLEKVAMDAAVQEVYESFALKFYANAERLRSVSLGSLCEHIRSVKMLPDLPERREIAMRFLDHLYEYWYE